MAVPRGSGEEQEEGGDGGGGGDPESESPHALVLEEPQNGVGEEGAEVQGEVEVAEEGDLGVALFRVLFVELVGAEGGNVGLIAAIAESCEVNREVEKGNFGFGMGSAGRLQIAAAFGSDQEQVGGE